MRIIEPELEDALGGHATKKRGTFRICDWRSAASGQGQCEEGDVRLLNVGVMPWE